jgi:hypothetical protein
MARYTSMSLAASARMSLVRQKRGGFGLTGRRCTPSAQRSVRAAGCPGDDVRPLVHQVMGAFWCHPAQAEAAAWRGRPYDSDRPGPRDARSPGHS